MKHRLAGLLTGSLNVAMLAKKRHGQASGAKPNLFRSPGRAKFALPTQNCTNSYSHKQPKI